MKKAYAAPSVTASGDVITNTMNPGGAQTEANGHSAVGAVGFYL